MSNTEDKVRDLLHEAGETHHIVFRLVNGADDDWASWYSEGSSTIPSSPRSLAHVR
jgi:hypothetical protein